MLGGETCKVRKRAGAREMLESIKISSAGGILRLKDSFLWGGGGTLLHVFHHLFFPLFYLASIFEA